MFSKISFSAALCIGAAIVSFGVQSYFWLGAEYVFDGIYWTPAIEQTADLGFPMSPRQTPGEQLGYSYAYPGTTLVYPGAFLVSLGLSPDTALRLVLAFLVSLGITLATWLAYRLRPESLWWIGVGGLLLANDLYFASTPASSAVMTLIPAMLIGTLLTKERFPVEKWPPYVLGIMGGIALATRFDIAAVILAMSFSYLLFTRRGALLPLILSGFATFVVANPYVWSRPLEYLTSTFERYFYSYTTIDYGLPFLYNISGVQIVVVTICFGIILLLMPAITISIPRSFLWAWAITSGILSCALTLSPYHPTWYFYPLILGWNTFLPLFLLDLADQIRLPPEMPWLTSRHLGIALLALLLGAQGLLFITLYWPV